MSWLKKEIAASETSEFSQFLTEECTDFLKLFVDPSPNEKADVEIVLKWFKKKAEKGKGGNYNLGLNARTGRQNCGRSQPFSRIPNL